MDSAQTANTRKPIVISSLAMRFYMEHGWTRDILEPYLQIGTLDSKDDVLEFAYLILTPHSALDIERLVADGHVGDLLGREDWGELKGKTDLEVLKYRNW